MSKKVLVVLDPGHYPNYNKGVASGYYEGNKMYDLTEYERDALKTYGIDVIVTRNRNNDMPLYDRGQVAVKKGKNYDEVVFISNHSNASNGKGYGVEVYRSIYLPDSAKLGQKLVDAIVKVMKPVTGVTYNRGVKTKAGNSGDYFGVIRGSVSGATSEAKAKKGPVAYSFLIEHGFHDHIKECAFLNKSDNLKKIAEAEAKVIAEYFGLSKTSSKEEKNITSEMYRVRKSWSDAKSQIGAFTSLVNAKTKANETPGYKVYNNAGKCVYTPKTVNKTNGQIAQEVIDGKWGNGADRKTKLAKAGYDYAAIQKIVNKKLAK